MIRNLLYCFVIFSFANTLLSCKHSKPKPVSNDISKTAVVDSGHKDSVIDNPRKNYGNASISEPCEKSLISIIKSSSSYQKSTNGVAEKSLLFVINWVKGSTPYHVENGGKITNGLEVDVNEKTGGMAKNLAAYIYNNENDRLYLRNAKNNFEEDQLKVDSMTLKRIRNSCYWGVASH